MDTDATHKFLETIGSLKRENEALKFEVSHLTEQNTNLSDQLELMRKANLKLKQNLSAVSSPATELNSPSPQLGRGLNRRALTAFQQPPFIKFNREKTAPIGESSPFTADKGISFSISESIKEEEPLSSPFTGKNEQPNQEKFQPEQVQTNINGSEENGNLSKLTEATEKFVQKIEQDEVQHIKQVLESIVDDSNKFCQVNNIVKMGAPSPFSKAEVNKTEKYIDGTEQMMRKWTKQIEEINKNCLAYTKSVQNFENQLLMDKTFFGANIELQNLLMLVAQVLEEHATYLEVFTQIVEDSVRVPLKAFYKTRLRSFKDPKKKVQKALEELENSQTKIMSTKKAAVLKDTASGQALLKSYSNAIKTFENSRIEYINCLNQLSIEINIELVEKLCNLVTGRMVHFNSVSYDTLASIEKQFNLMKGTIPKKIKIQDELNIEFERLKENISSDEPNQTRYQSPPNVVKEGYLFIKFDNKDTKKRYCVIRSDGILYWVKDVEAGTENPQLNELANLKLCSVKQKPELDQSFSFELVDASVKKPITIQTDSAATMTEWMTIIKKVIERLLSMNISLDDLAAGFKVVAASHGTSLETLPDLRGPSSKQQLVSRIIKDNVCADCSAKDPSWLSLNLGVTICIQCSGIHRQLGANVSKVRSLKLDNLSIAVLRLFSQLPTESANDVWEGLLKERATMRPVADSDKDVRNAWIRLKYVDRALIKILKEGDPVKVICQAIQNKDLLKAFHVIAVGSINLNEVFTIEGKQQTLLHYACSKSSLEIVELLIRNGCDVKATDGDNLKPIDCAMLANNVEVVEHLLGNVKTFEI